MRAFPSPTFATDELGHRATLEILPHLVGVRLLAVPVVATVVLALGWGPVQAWRMAVLLGALAVMSVGSWVARARVRSHGVERHSLDANMLLNVVGQLLVVVGTGGIESPLAPTLLAIGALVSLFCSTPIALTALFGLHVPLIVVLGGLQVSGRLPSLLPASLVGPDHASALLAWRTAALVVFLLAIGAVARNIRSTLGRVAAEIDTARTGQLQTHLEQNRALTTLAGEIAHELKNPLASIKGLSVLLARGADGRDAERFTVLRREIDRMQHTLEEFLNFSRPLVPLALETVDAARLVGEVVLMHEGVAVERSVHIVDESEGAVAVRCDPRKVRQMLVNVVQNALDASPAGSTVRVDAAPGEGNTVVLRVRDEGMGLDVAVADRVFDAGVTTKASGSGLGLTIARTLARQHGGDLTLSQGEGDGRGCVAVIHLPDDAIEALSAETLGAAPIAGMAT